MGRYVKGIVTGAVIGTAVGMMLLPELDKKSRKSVRKMGKKLAHAAEDKYDNIMHWWR